VKRRETPVGCTDRFCPQFHNFLYQQESSYLLCKQLPHSGNQFIRNFDESLRCIFPSSLIFGNRFILSLIFVMIKNAFDALFIPSFWEPISFGLDADML
jgi:hypothetical protein